MVGQKVSEKVTGRKEEEKVAFTSGRGNVGHKAAECMVHMVGEMGLESEKSIGEVAEEPRWVVAGMAEVSKNGRKKERR